MTASLVYACGGGAKSQPNTTPKSAPPTNSSPTISGIPDSAVVQDQAYEFIPSASDPDGDALSFSIVNGPGWASFDTTTGKLSGTPLAAHIGVTTGVVISVSDGVASASLAPFDIEVEAIRLGSATVSWSAPSTNADDTVLTDLAGFRVHYGTASRDYSFVSEIDDPAANSAVIKDLDSDTWFFAVTAVDRNDNESAFSTEVSKVVQP
jgi:hypothetical protein